MFSATIFYIYNYQRFVAELAPWVGEKYQPVINIMKAADPRQVVDNDFIFVSENHGREVVFNEFLAQCSRLKLVSV